MILCRKNGYWYLAVRAIPNSKGCALRVGAQMSNEGGFGPPPGAGQYLVRQVQSTEGIQIFPQLSYRGCRVSPEYWNPETSEPVLRCFLQPEEIGPELLGGAPVPDYVNQFPQFLRLVQEDGWKWDMRDGGTKYIHVDDLEKIEGPPPEGPF